MSNARNLADPSWAILLRSFLDLPKVFSSAWEFWKPGSLVMMIGCECTHVACSLQVESSSLKMLTVNRTPPDRRATIHFTTEIPDMNYSFFFQDLPYDPKSIPADIFFLGYLRETIGVRLKPLNPRYTYDEVPLKRWLQSQSGLPLPFLFAKVDDDVDLMRSLWVKTEQIHHLQKSHQQNLFH